MKLYLMRHAEAVPGERNDAARNLTEQGIADARSMAVFLRHQVGTVDVIITSPFVRSVDTALIFGLELGVQRIPQNSFLDPDVDPGQAWDAIIATAGNAEYVLVVTHHPLVNALLLKLCGTAAEMPHGAIAHIDGGQLHWLVTPMTVELSQIAEAARELSVAYVDESLKHPKHEAQLDPLKAAARAPLAKYFTRQGRKLLKAIDAHLKHLGDGNRNVSEADKDAKEQISYALPAGYRLPVVLTAGMKADYGKTLGATLEAGYDTLALDNGSDSEIKADVVEQYLRDHSLEKLTGELDQTSVERLRSALADTYAAGGDYGDLVETIKEEFSDFAAKRTELIAQTEMNNAYNQGRKYLGLDLGFNEKSWSADGPAPCPVCIGNVLDGWIGMEEEFSSGDLEPTSHPGCFCSLDVRFNSKVE